MYIARQPIFDNTKNVYGYELLFRNSDTASSYIGTTAESSTAVVMGGLFELGVDKIVGKKKAFVNFNYNSLLSDTIELIDPSTLIIEVLEDVIADSKILERIGYLRKKGYKIALDDFEKGIESFEIVPMADIIKYDVLSTPLDTIEEEVKLALGKKKIILAEKVETEEAFIKAKKMGFHLFQGYFFSKPSIVGNLSGRRPDIGSYQRILSELHADDPSFTNLAEIVETDVDLAYRLVKIMSMREDYDIQNSIKRALTNMGLVEFERWIHIMMLQDISAKKPRELVRSSLIRSKFGELIAAKTPTLRHRKSEVSLMCLFSVIDAMLNMPMDEAMKDINVSKDIKDALIHRKGVLEPVLSLSENYERGEWASIDNITKQMGIDSGALMSWYIDAIKWAENIVENYYV